MRLQATAQLAAKNHAASLASLATPPQKCCIMEWFVAAASSARLKRLPLGVIKFYMYPKRGIHG
jgi:hypothetical protein